MIQVTNVSKTYGGQEIFQNINFNINPKERIGVVGRNGQGKTTLFRLILGEEDSDNGNISKPKNYTIGHLDQHIKMTQNTVLKEACLGLPKGHEADTWMAEKILFGLGFTKTDMDRHPDEFSGGFQIRINLAKVLVGNPNLLLLDEPTNYLDILSIRWLVRFLNSWKGELLVISHDRGFMDQVVTHILGIHRKKVRKIEGKTDKYYEQILAEEEIHEKTRINDEKKRKETELFITRFRAKARLGGLVQSRIKTLAKMEKLDKLDKLPELEFSFPSMPFESRWILETQNLTFSYDHKPPYILDHLDLTIRKNDRIAVIGKNGKGKSTLLKLLAGELNPVSGEVKIHPQLKFSYYGQTNIDRLNSYHTVEEEILSVCNDATRPLARTMCGVMLFEGESALKKVSVLSGGEKARVLLGKMLLSPSHFLLLDEPTNHLDMESCDALISAVDSYDGTVIFVTHNEMLLNAVATRFIIFDNDKITLFEGSYEDFLEQIGWKSEEEENKSDAERQKVAGITNKKAIRKAKSEIITERSKALKPLENKMRAIEEKLKESEEEHHNNNHAIIEASTASDGKRIAELSKRNHQLSQEIEGLYMELDALTTEYEEKSREFNERLEEYL